MKTLKLLIKTSFFDKINYFLCFDILLVLVTLKTEPSSVSDLTLDLSDYCLPTLYAVYGSSTSLGTSDAGPRLSPAPSLPQKNFPVYFAYSI